MQHIHASVQLHGCSQLCHGSWPASVPRSASSSGLHPAAKVATTGVAKSVELAANRIKPSAAFNRKWNWALKQRLTSSDSCSAKLKHLSSSADNASLHCTHCCVNCSQAVLCCMSLLNVAHADVKHDVHADASRQQHTTRSPITKPSTFCMVFAGTKGEDAAAGQPAIKGVPHILTYGPRDRLISTQFAAKVRQHAQNT